MHSEAPSRESQGLRSRWYFFLFGIVLLITPAFAGAQGPSTPKLSYINPTQAVAGQAVRVIVRGNNFIPDRTVFNLGPGIAVSEIRIVSMTMASMTLTISPSAPIGAHDLTARTGTASSVLTHAFLVLQSSSTPPSSAPRPRKGPHSAGTNAGGAPQAGEPAQNTAPPTPKLTAIIPSNGARGQTLSVTVRGNNFMAGTTRFSLGPGITVSGTKILDMTTASMTLTISPSAPVGVRDLTATTGTATVALVHAFAVN